MTTAAAATRLYVFALIFGLWLCFALWTRASGKDWLWVEYTTLAGAGLLVVLSFGLIVWLTVERWL
jgi:hypothetical protein